MDLRSRSAIGIEVALGLASERGGRPDNQDYAACFTGDAHERARFGIVAALADGVGGAKGGRVAAETAVRGFIDGYLGLGELRGVRRNSADSLEAVNRWIHAVGRTDPDLAGMCTTLTVLILRGRQAHVIHVGDSRLYRLRDGELAPLTQDHVPERSAMRNVLTRAVGAADHVAIDYVADAARVHDRYLLCSDGVHGALSDRMLRDELARREAPDATADRLVAAALASDLGDNATALMIDVLDLPPADRGDLELAIAAYPIVPVPQAGATVDGFVLDRIMADGRYTRVFRAVDEASGRAVIVKFPKAVTATETTLRQAFLREAWIAARIKSPFVCEVIEPPSERRSCLYTVMPFYAGETLEARLSRPPRPSLAIGLDVAQKLVRALTALHRAGVIHRDIKPENVILEPDGGLKLVDLGVARLANLDDFPSEDIPGTPSYMAPELIAGAPGDERSDLFAWGVTIFRLFTRVYPYGEIEPFSRPRFTRIPSLLTHRPDLPAWLDRILARALAVAPDERFEDAIELAFALEQGALGAAPAPPRRRPLLERDPLRFWQVTSLLLALTLGGLILHLLSRG